MDIGAGSTMHEGSRKLQRGEGRGDKSQTDMCRGTGGGKDTERLTASLSMHTTSRTPTGPGRVRRALRCMEYFGRVEKHRQQPTSYAWKEEEEDIPTRHRYTFMKLEYR